MINIDEPQVDFGLTLINIDKPWLTLVNLKLAHRVDSAAPSQDY